MYAAHDRVQIVPLLYPFMTYISVLTQIERTFSQFHQYFSKTVTAKGKYLNFHYESI